MDKFLQMDVVKVLLLSVTPRSGSSYISEVLASVPLATLWTEPLRFLYEKPPIVSYSGARQSPVATNETLVKKDKDKRYRLGVPRSEKLQLISDFMDCKFEAYRDIIASQVSRQFVFKLPKFCPRKNKG